MLERLNEVDWARLTHAFGEASDVPGYIRAMTSNDKEERAEAIGTLFGTIWHQGTVYEATAFAVPFLVELLEYRHVVGKDEILHLLACIAAGHSHIEVHAGAFEQMGMGPGSEQERVDHELRRARELGWVRAASAAVEAGVPTYLRLLFDDDPIVRIFAAYTLAHCPGRGNEVVPELVAWVPSEEQAGARAGLILALAALKTTRVGRDEANRLFTDRIGPTEPPVVRLAAAMSLAKSSPGEPTVGMLDVLTESTASAWSDFEQLPWCEGGVAVTVGESLADHPDARLRFLFGLLDRGSAEVRKGALFAVGVLCRERRSVTPPTAAGLSQRVLVGDLADRREVAKILSELGSASASAVSPLRAVLDDDDSQLRLHAAVALARLRDRCAIPALIALLDMDRDFLKVVESLGELGAMARDAVPLLLQVLKRKPPESWMWAHNGPIRVATTLGEIGPAARSAVPALIALMRRQPHTQRAVGLALGRIGGPEVRAALPILKDLLRSQDGLIRSRQPVRSGNSTAVPTRFCQCSSTNSSLARTGGWPLRRWVRWVTRRGRRFRRSSNAWRIDPSSAGGSCFMLLVPSGGSTAVPTTHFRY